jgi:gluconate kinase
MAQPQVDIITPNGEAPIESKTGKALFDDVVAAINSSNSQFEAKIANRFNSLKDDDRKTWLKAAGVALHTDYVTMGGEPITTWRQLKRDQRNRMMTAYRCMKAIVKGGV